MGEKDIVEKYLESYNDVFSDIVNVLLFKGRHVMQPNQLINNRARSVYKAEGEIHEQERDISNFWKKRGVHIAVYGIENQSKIDKMMPLRVVGYDGTSYREQLLKNAPEQKCPVITVVLYFGTDRPWEKPLKLSDCFAIPEELQPYFSDYRIQVFNIAFLSDETIQSFKSDFRIVADYFSQKRKYKRYIPSKKTMKHVDAVLKLMSVMTGDHRFEEVQKTGRRLRSMCEIMDQVEQRGIQKGIQEGQMLLINAVKYLNKGETEEQLLSRGMDPETVKRAISFRLEIMN